MAKKSAATAKKTTAILYLIFTAVSAVILSGLIDIEMVSLNIAAFVGIILAVIFLYGLEGVIVVPVATCVMINDYHKAIAGQPLKRDLYGKLCKVSKKFKELFKKSGQPMPAEPSKMPTSL